VASIVGDGDLSADEREAMLAQTFDLYTEFTGRDGLADIAATRGGKAEKGIEQMTKVDVGELAMFVLECAANNLRKANPALSQEQAFAKAYVAPENHEAQKAERASSRRRLAGVGLAQTEPEILNVLSDADIKRLIARERAKFPFLDGKELLAIVENSEEMQRHRAAVRQAQAAGRRDSATLMSAAFAKRDDAMSELQVKADEIRKAQPGLTEEMAFSKAYKLYPALASAERAASREALWG
jgi:hypothetical protein